VTKPLLQALLLADHVYEDKHTGKRVICGVFSKLFFIPQDAIEKVKASESTKPEGFTREAVLAGHQMGSPWAYLSLTELRGEESFELRYVDLEDNTVLFKVEFMIKCPDPLQTVEVVLPLPPLPLPLNAPQGQQSRVCALELLYDNELLGAHRITVQPSAA
jgi:hypothetical protein